MTLKKITVLWLYAIHNTLCKKSEFWEREALSEEIDDHFRPLTFPQISAEIQIVSKQCQLDVISSTSSS